jgi:hypothetical protein
MFCRKVNIPFVVYGFTNNLNTDSSTHGPDISFSKEEGELQVRKVVLREMISSNMKTATFTQAIKNQLRIKNVYENHPYSDYYLPEGEHLTNTPLNEALIATKSIIENFKIKNNLDMVNLVIVHDGDADSNYYVNQKGHFNHETQNVFLKDKKSKVQVKVPKTSRGVTAALMEYVTKTTGAKVMGFFIAGSSRDARSAILNYYEDKNGKTFTSRENFIGNYRGDLTKLDDLRKELRKEKFIQSYTAGYNKLFIIPGGSSLKIEDENITVEGKITASKLATAFMKVNKTRQTNRVMIGRFIEAIATH